MRPRWSHDFSAFTTACFACVGAAVGNGRCLIRSFFESGLFGQENFKVAGK